MQSRVCSPGVQIVPVRPHLCQQRRPAAHRSRQQCVVRAGLGDVGKYLSDAAASVFKTGDSNVPWSGSSFSGDIRHHEGDVQRLKRLYEVVQSTRQQLTGCMDPKAANYDPEAVSEDGSCTYIFQDDATGGKTQGDLHTYVTSTLQRIWDTKGDGKQPDFTGTGFGYSGDVVSQRDVERLLRYESVIKETLKKAEAEKKQKTSANA